MKWVAIYLSVCHSIRSAILSFSHSLFLVHLVTTSFPLSQYNQEIDWSFLRGNCVKHFNFSIVRPNPHGSSLFFDWIELSSSVCWHMVGGTPPLRERAGVEEASSAVCTIFWSISREFVYFVSLFLFSTPLEILNMVTHQPNKLRGQMVDV